jgi:hypothetical protein
MPFSAVCQANSGPSRPAHAVPCRPLPPKWPCKWPCKPTIQTVCRAGWSTRTSRPGRAPPERASSRLRAARVASQWGKGGPSSMLRVHPILCLSLPILATATRRDAGNRGRAPGVVACGTQ